MAVFFKAQRPVQPVLLIKFPLQAVSVELTIVTKLRSWMYRQKQTRLLGSRRV
jgi:hypothetical protein